LGGGDPGCLKREGEGRFRFGRLNVSVPDHQLAVSAIRKLETRTKLQNEMQNGVSERLMFQPPKGWKS
jgi:hypothetical protein